MNRARLAAAAVMVLAAGPGPPALAQDAASGLATSERSLISVLQPPGDPACDQVVDAFRREGRFEYHPVPFKAPSGDSGPEDFVSGFRTYLQENAARLAGRGEVPDFKFGDVVITREMVDRMMASAYVMVPRWSVGKISVTEASEKDKGVDASGNRKVERIERKGSALVSLRVDFINVASGERLETLSGSGLAVRTMSEWEAAPDESTSAETFFGASLSAARVKAIGQVMTQARKLAPFRLQAFLEADGSGGLRLAGPPEGIEYDSTFLVSRKIKAGERFKLLPGGWVKIRDAPRGRFQTIRDTIGLEVGDRLTEHPQSGLDAAVRAGFVTFDPGGGRSLAPAVTLSFEWNLAPSLKDPRLSETYLTLDVSGLAALPTSAIQFLPGVKKRFYFGQFIVAVGMKGAYLRSWTPVGETVEGQKAVDGRTAIPKGTNIDAIGGGLGLGPSVGLEWQWSPDLKFGVETGYLFATPVHPNGFTASNGWFAEKSYDFDLGKLPGVFPPPDANATGPVLSVSITY